MFNADLVEEYIEIIKEDPELYYQDYLKAIEKSKVSTALYKGEPIPITYQGMFVSEKDVAEFERISRIMMSISRKVAKEYVENPSYRELFNFSPDLEELILVDPGYDIPVPIARYDIFYNGPGDFKFCEFNTDGSSAMNEDDVLGKILLETKAFQAFGESYEISQFELFKSWVEKTVELYREYKFKDHPVVAIVDFTDKGTTKEFERFVQTYEEMGYRCFIADIRDLEYRDGSLVYQGEKIDLVYRRAVTMDIMDKLDQVQDFIQAYKDGVFMMVGSFRSHMMHSKLIFKILLDSRTKLLLESDENKFIEKHIPFTANLNTEEDYKKVLTFKNKYILKPHEGYASQGIYSGREHDEEEWKEILDRIYDQGYIYQDYVDVDPVDFVEFIDGKLEVNPFGFVMGLFIYKEEFQGLYTRIGREALISGARDYYTSPNFLVKP